MTEMQYEIWKLLQRRFPPCSECMVHLATTAGSPLCYSCEMEIDGVDESVLDETGVPFSVVAS